MSQVYSPGALVEFYHIGASGLVIALQVFFFSRNILQRDIID
jgi:hypothetical protein